MLSKNVQINWKFKEKWAEYPLCYSLLLNSIEMITDTSLLEHRGTGYQLDLILLYEY